MLRSFEKQAFSEYKNQITVLRYWIAGRETRVGEHEARRPFCES